MGQKAVEVILMRQLASYLAVPIVVVDPAGDLVFFNESAQPLVSRPFEEIDAIRRGEWSARFQPTREDGTPVPREDQPLFIATERREPAHRRYWLQGLDGVRRQVEGLGFPLIGQGDRMLGAVGIFWDVSNPKVPSDAQPPPGSEAPRRPVEVILMKQLASYLTIPMLLIGPEGHLQFFNESAEPLLGARFDELDVVPLEEWSNVLQSADEDRDDSSLSLITELQTEMTALTDGSHASPWPGGPPARTAESLAPYRDRLSALYCEGIVRVEILQKNKGFNIEG